MRRVHVLRALLSGLVAAIVGLAVAYVVAPGLGLPSVDPFRWLAVNVGGVDPAARAQVGARGWLLSLLLAAAVALLFAALWDLLPPRARPLSKALVFSALLLAPLAAAGLPLAAIPALVAFALTLGAAYRPHPTPARGQRATEP